MATTPTTTLCARNQVLNEPNLKRYMGAFNSTPAQPPCVSGCRMLPLPHNTYYSGTYRPASPPLHTANECR